jgi:hypothetical protein
MSLVAKFESTSNFIPVPQGMHLARCYQIIDLGTQKTEYMGNIKNLHKVMFNFEVHSESDDGRATVTNKGEPMIINKNYTMSLAEKATMRKDLQTWRGQDFTAEELRGFELKKVLGAWCMLSIVKAEGSNGKSYTNIAAVMPVPSSVKKAGLPTPHNELKMFSIDSPDMDLFESFSDYLKGKIGESPEWKARNYDNGFSTTKSESPKVESEEELDDCPF